MYSGRLSPHFALVEFTRSQVAERWDIDNTPPPLVRLHLLRLCDLVLEPLRVAVGALHISSGYRSPILNRRVGGSAVSQHPLGLAADVVHPQMSSLELCQAVVALHLPFDQLIHEGSWMHVSVAPQNVPRRAQVLTARFVNGKAVYSPGLPER